jgi:integrase
MSKHGMTDLKAKKMTDLGFHHDGGRGAARGLYLQIAPSTAKGAKPSDVVRSWAFRFVSPVHKREDGTGQPRWMGLGPVDLYTLGEAREKAIAARKLLKDGIDPIDQRERNKQAAALAAAKNKTFGEVAKEFLADRKDEWKNEKHAAQWEMSLTTMTKSINSLPVAAIDTDLVLGVLRPIWKKTPETASRVRGRIEAVISYATVSKYRTGENPARWRGHLEHMLARRSKIAPVEHHKALPYAELPAFMAKLRDNKAASAKALEWTILCAARTGETIYATWPEIDAKAKTWTVPASRMKAGKEHVVPLSDRCMAILEGLPREGDDGFLFPGARDNKPLSNMAMLQLLRGMVGDGHTVHGTARSSFSDWSGDRTNFDRQTIEFALAHGITDKTEAAYRRSTAIEKRRRLMVAWSQYCESRPVESATVVPISRAAKAP